MQFLEEAIIIEIVQNNSLFKRTQTASQTYNNNHSKYTACQLFFDLSSEWCLCFNSRCSFPGYFLQEQYLYFFHFSLQLSCVTITTGIQWWWESEEFLPLFVENIEFRGRAVTNYNPVSLAFPISYHPIVFYKPQYSCSVYFYLILYSYN